LYKPTITWNTANWKLPNTYDANGNAGKSATPFTCK